MERNRKETKNETLEEMERYHKQAKKTHAIFSFALIAFALAKGFTAEDAGLEVETKTTLQTIATLLLLIVTPLSLKLYKKAFEEYPEDDLRKKIRHISKLQMYRLCANTAVMFFLILMYSLTADPSFLYCEAISAIVILFFCRPDSLEVNE